MSSQSGIFTGPGLRAATFGSRVMVDAAPPPSRWEPAWFLRYDAKGNVYVGRGTVNGRVPEISGVPIDGVTEDGKVGPPSLLIPKNISKVHVMIVARVDADGRAEEKDAYTIRLGELLRTGDAQGFVGLHPIGVLNVDVKSGKVRDMYQLTHFDLQHRAVRRVDISGDLLFGNRHFFW